MPLGGQSVTDLFANMMAESERRRSSGTFQSPRPSAIAFNLPRPSVLIEGGDSSDNSLDDTARTSVKRTCLPLLC